MPPIHTPLAERNSNGHRGPKLSEFVRGRIIRMHNAGKKKAEIHQFYDYLYSTVKDTINKDVLRDNRHSIPRSGAPKSWTLSEEHRVLYHIYSFLKDIYAKVIKVYSVGFKKSTIKKI
jgi:hypothetical protein